MITFTRCAFMAKQACTTFSQVVQKITPPVANNFLKFFFALFAILTLNAATAWAETWSHTFTSTESAGSKNWDNINWVLTINGGTTSSYDSDKGAHYGTNNNTCTSVSFTTSGIKGTISSIKIEASRGSSLVGKLSISVGDQEYTLSNNATSHALTTTNTAYDFQGNNSGNIAISWKKTSGKGAFYIKSITVTYEEVASCDKKVTLTKGSETNGTFTLDKANGSYDNCDEDFVVKVSNVVPTSSSQYCSSVNVTGGNSTVTGPVDGVWTVTYAKGNNITSTITPTFADKTSATITISEAGATSSVSGKYVGDSYTLPSTSSKTCGDKKFVGWSTVEIDNSAEKPTSNFHEPGASVTLAASQTFYAVFAEGDGSEILTSITGGDWSTGADGDWSTYGTGTYSGNGVKFDHVGDYVLSPSFTAVKYTKLLLKFKSGYNGNEGSVLTFYVYNASNILLTNENVTISPTTIVPSDTYTKQNTIYQVSMSANEVIGSVMIKMTSKTSNLGMKYCELFGVSYSYQNYTTSCVKTYKVTFNANDHGTAPTAQNVEENTKATEPTAPSATGYTFGGWYTDQACSDDKKFNFDTPITEDITLYAKWTANTYTITLDANGGKFVKDGNESETIEIQYVYGTYANYDQAKLISDYLAEEGIKLSREGYQLNEMWQSNGSAWKRVFTAINRTITAQWSKLHTVTFNTGTNNPTIDAIKGTSETGITLPAGPTPACTDWTFAGWAEASVTETTTKPTLLSQGNNYKPTEDCTLYAVYSQTETTLGEGEELSQTLKYDSWSYEGSTTDKGDYRMFHTGSYVESAPFDLSILTKVVIYGGTFGGDKYNSLTIGDGANVWKTVAVTGNSQTGVNSFTNGNALSGHGKLRITSNSGTASTNGVRISKIEIYTISSIITTTYNSNPDCTTPEPTKYNVIITPTTNGSVTANHTNAEEGKTITLTVTPETGYVLDALTVTDASSNPVTVTDNKFTMPASDVTVSATFKQDESGEVESNSTATIVFASNANQEDGSSQVITEQTEIDKVVAQGVEFVSGFADVSKVYPNSVHGLKLGTGSAIGKITIGLNISKKVSKITFKTYQYKEKEATIKFSAGGKEGSTSEFGDYTLTFDEPTTVSQIVISTGQVSKGRAYVSQIDIELAEDEAGEGGEDPVVPTPTVNPTATFVFNTADGLAKLGIAYPTTADGASKKTNIENNTTVISNGVGLTMTGGTTTATRVWLTPSGVLDLRVYEGATLTFAVADGFEIIKVDFEGSNLTNLAVGDNRMTDAIWEGNQKSVTFKNLDEGVKINTIAVTVAYTRDVTQYEYGTICLPYGSSNYTGAKFYEVSWLKEGVGLYLDELAANDELEAGKPYIFQAPTSGEIEIICTGEAVINPVDGKAGLTGTFTKIQDLQTSDPSNTLEGNYMIADNKIWLCGTSCWLNANRAYIKDSKLPKTEQAKIPGRRRVCMGENTTTDFENITNGENNTIKVIENGQLIIIRNGEKFNAQGIKL